MSEPKQTVVVVGFEINYTDMTVKLTPQKCTKTISPAA